MIKSDKWIKDKAINNGLIFPFVPQLIRATDNFNVLSYGVSSYGYDIRLCPSEFKVFSAINSNALEINPKKFDLDSLINLPLRIDEDGSYFLLPAHSYGLGVTLETFQMPSNVSGIVLGKSTYARCSVVLNTTLLEAGWKGRLVLEFANTNALPVRLFVEEGIGQVIFLESDEYCENPYSSDRKYQNQKGLTLAKV